jgi:hypothetical protein
MGLLLPRRSAFRDDFWTIEQICSLLLAVDNTLACCFTIWHTDIKLYHSFIHIYSNTLDILLCTCGMQLSAWSYYASVLYVKIVIQCVISCFISEYNLVLFSLCVLLFDFHICT